MNSLSSLLPPIEKFRSFTPFEADWSAEKRLWGQEIFEGARLEFAVSAGPKLGFLFRFVFTPEVEPAKCLWLQALMTMGRGQVTGKLFQFNAREVDSFLRLSALEPCLALDQLDLIKWDRELRKTLLIGFMKACAEQSFAEASVPEKHAYVEVNLLLRNWLHELKRPLGELLSLELVCLELKRANPGLKENRVVISSKLSPALNEIFSQQELLASLTELSQAFLKRSPSGSSFIPLKWVAEG